MGEWFPTLGAVRTCTAELLTMERIAIRLAAVLVATGCCAAEGPSFLESGQCPDLSLQPFEAAQFSGVWYRIGGIPTFEEKAVNCTRYNYQNTPEGFEISSDGIDAQGAPVTQLSMLTYAGDDTTVGNFTTLIRDRLEASVYVLNTDYSSFACLYSCYPFQKSHKAQFAWIYSRETTLPREKIALCQREFRDKGTVKINKLRGTYQGRNCIRA